MIRRTPIEQKIELLETIMSNPTNKLSRICAITGVTYPTCKRHMSELAKAQLRKEWNTFGFSHQKVWKLCKFGIT